MPSQVSSAVDHSKLCGKCTQVFHLSPFLTYTRFVGINFLFYRTLEFTSPNSKSKTN